MKSRLVFIFIVFSFIWGGLILRAGYLQVFPNSKLSKLSKKQYNSRVTLLSRRGTIYDRTGRELAVSVNAYSLFADPSIIKSPYQVSKKIARQLRMSRRNLQRKLSRKNTKFVWLKRRLNQKQKQKIAQLKIRGLGFIEESKRIYPNNHMLSQTLGFVGSDGLGLEGLEQSLDNYLKGSRKTIRVQRDARGRPLLMEEELFNPPADGSDVRLTVDGEYQYMLEKELSKTVHELRADSAVGVVLDAQTSKILAIANVPTFNVNAPLQYTPGYRRNRVVSDGFEPGSTMKTFVVASALENNIVQPNTEIDCEDGKLKIGKRVIREADAHHSFKKLTVSEVLARSSNVGTSKIAFMLGDKKLKDYYSKLGFGKRVTTEMPGSAKGIVNKLPWGKHQLANISFGHGLTSTPLQIASAYAAIANGGWLKSPSIVNSIVNSEGDEEKIESKPPERVISKRVAEILRLMLTGATSQGGTGVSARVPGYQVAGKTGTAQKVDFVKGGYMQGAYISSFAGFVPSHDPKFVIYIAIDNPKGKYYGSTVAAPIFSRVASYLLRKAGVDPILISKSDVLGSMDPFFKEKKKQKSITQLNLKSGEIISHVPDVQGLSLREVMKLLKQQEVHVQAKGVGIVVGTQPEVGESLGVNRKIKLILEPSH